MEPFLCPVLVKNLGEIDGLWTHFYELAAWP